MQCMRCSTRCGAYAVLTAHSATVDALLCAGRLCARGEQARHARRLRVRLATCQLAPAAAASATAQRVLSSHCSRRPARSSVESQGFPSHTRWIAASALLSARALALCGIAHTAAFCICARHRSRQRLHCPVWGGLGWAAWGVYTLSASPKPPADLLRDARVRALNTGAMLPLGLKTQSLNPKLLA